MTVVTVVTEVTVVTVVPKKNLLFHTQKNFPPPKKKLQKKNFTIFFCNFFKTKFKKKIVHQKKISPQNFFFTKNLFTQKSGFLFTKKIKQPLYTKNHAIPQQKITQPLSKKNHATFRRRKNHAA